MEGFPASARVLYISYDGMTDSLGQSQVIAYLKRLGKKGVTITILSFEKQEVFKEKRNVIENDLSGTTIKWVPLYYTKKPPIFSTIKDIFSGIKTATNLHKNESFTIVHCRGYIAGLIGRSLKKKFPIKQIFDMRGWWPDEKKESNAWEGIIYMPVYKYFKWVEKKLFKESDKVISLTYSGKREIVKNHWKKPEEIGVIPTCVDFEIFQSFQENIKKQVRVELEIPLEAKVIVYSGSLGGNYSLQDLFNIYKAFVSVDPNGYFLILSKTDPSIVLNHLLNHNISAKQIIVKSVDFKSVYKYLQASDVGIILYQKSFSVIGRSPTKLGEYWACGIPVLSLKGIGDLDEIAEQYSDGIELVEDFSFHQLRLSMIKLFDKGYQKELLNEFSREYFSIDTGVEFYYNIYRELS